MSMIRHAALPLSALVAVACTSSSSGSPTTTSSPLPTGVYSRVFDAALPLSKDLPPGWIEAQPASQDSSYGDQLCGRIAALDNRRSASSRTGSAEILFVTIPYYASGNASSVLSENRKCTSVARDVPAARGGTYHITGLSVKNLGDDSIGYQFTTNGNPRGELFSAGEAIRRGDFVMAVSLISDQAVDVEQLQTFAGIADAKLASAIAANQ